MEYRAVYEDEGVTKVRNLDMVELNSNRNDWLEKQNNNKRPIIFCRCNHDDGIPMILTNHSPTPHFQTKAKVDQAKHFLFCPHYINTANRIPYVPAITIDEQGNEIAHVSFSKSDIELEREITREYRDRNRFLSNSGNRVHKGKMSFDAFVKHKNMQYFRINQYKKREYDIQKYTLNLKSYIAHSNVNGKELCNSGKGNFFYYVVDSVETNEHGNYYVINYNSDKIIKIKVAIIDDAKARFSQTHNRLGIDDVLLRNDCRLIIYGFKDTTKTKFPKYTHVSFLMTNRNGLYSESLYEVRMYNMICENILHDGSGYIFYKPTRPENDYYKHPNYIADGVIRGREQGTKAIIEVFGRNDPDYLYRKHEKELTCKHEKVFWDVFDPDSFSECEDKINLMK